MEVKTRQTHTELFEAFQDHMQRTRGTQDSECRKYERYVRLFVESVGGGEIVDVSVFTASDVIHFIESLVGRYKPKTIRHVSTALRNFFRFLRFERLRDDRLDEAVPGVVHRRFSELPRYLDTNQLELFIAGLDRSTACARRDRAMLLCTARLGLRPSEVVRIRLEDIDWRSAELHVPTRKTGRGARLPLVDDVGEAIIEYIKNGRPHTTARHVFVLHHNRIGEPATQQTMSDAVSVALDKAGIDAPIRGPNLLRHTLATRLIRSGASLKEISDLLVSYQTTY